LGARINWTEDDETVTRRRKKEVIRMRETSYVDDWCEAEAIKREFQSLANSLARLGRKGNSEDVINLMAWEIGDLRRAIALADTKRREGTSRDE
jgi:hypothetical protein